MAKILVAEDEPGILEFLVDTLEFEDHVVVAVSNGRDAVRCVERESFDVVVTDLKMPKLDGMGVLAKIQKLAPETEVVVLTAHGSVDVAVQAMKLGAFDFLQKPISGPDALCLVVERALERRGMRVAIERAERTQPDKVQLAYGDPRMEPTVKALERVAKTTATVLLLGESGTGKEVAARFLHEHSPRRNGPFMAVNCAALSESLFESELFGHERGAFTGAHERRKGRLELAAGGTFFLDEIGELTLASQAKLLRVLQEKCFERVGGTRTLHADVRWIAATNRNLSEEIAEGHFREDLYHRIAVFPVRLPPLRDRTQDILPIAQVILAQVCAELGRRRLTLSSGVQASLQRWSWPGNIRELGNVLERAAILAEGDVIEEHHLWLEASSQPNDPLKTLAEAEREMIERALRHVQGNRRRAAELLGIAERTLYDKIKRHHIEA